MKKQLYSDKSFARFRQTLGQRIQELRKNKGITQEELSSLVGLDRVSIGYIEQGVRTPKLRTLLSIATALECPVSDIFVDI